LIVITGTGKHSTNGKAKIRPAVINYLNQYMYTFDVDDGEIVVRNFV